MSAVGHLRLRDGWRTYKFACGVERNPWGSMQISSCTNPNGVTCGNCKRTKAFKSALKAAS